MKVPRHELFKLQADICKTLADPNRLAILHELRDGEKSVGEIVTALGLRQSNTSRHLAVMRDRGLVAARRDGTTIYYGLTNEQIGAACDLVQQVLESRLAHSQELAASLDKLSR